MAVTYLQSNVVILDPSELELCLGKANNLLEKSKRMFSWSYLDSTEHRHTASLVSVSVSSMSNIWKKKGIVSLDPPHKEERKGNAYVLDTKEFSLLASISHHALEEPLQDHTDWIRSETFCPSRSNNLRTRSNVALYPIDET
jgi:hypothetical protein